MPKEVVKYRRPTRILHWIHAGSFVTLFLTGLILFIPGLSILAQDGWTRLLHRIVALVFVVIPLIYLFTNWEASLKKIKEAFQWGSEDIDWLQAAPRYYFLGDEKAMPPQGAMNSGQKLWWLMTVVFSLVFVITGFIMVFFKTIAPAPLLQWSVFFHDIAFIATGAMLFLHIYLGVFHPLMRGAWDAMARGKVSVEYARSHHAKWYEEVVAQDKAKPTD